MGTSFTQEKLNKIRSQNQPINNNEEINKNKKYKKNENISDILNNIYSSIYKKHFKNCYKNEGDENIINENKKIVNEENKNNIINNINDDEKMEKEINNIIFRNHKSIDFSLGGLYESLLDKNLNENIIEEKCNKEIYSDKDNESNNSDYIDISKEFLLFNKKNENKKLQSNKIRDSYYHKLIIKNQWNPFKKDKIFNNLFFFDWDDTLLCTTYLISTGALEDMEINLKDKEIFTNLDTLVYQLLFKAINLGFAFIVTNGAPGWVEYSSVKYYPKSAKLLTNVKIISARGLCEKKLPGDVRQWKTNAFKYAIDSIEIKKNIPTNILCFGDSIIEMEASYNIKEYFSNAYLKTIKFKESPTQIELEKELKIIIAQLDSILTNFKNLSIKVTRKKTE